MMFAKYLVVDDDVNIHNTSEVLFQLCANTDPQRDLIFTKKPADVLDHATSEVAIGQSWQLTPRASSQVKEFKKSWPPLIRMNDEVRRKADDLFGKR
jgi:4-hydroxy-3-polyprenylbenzoate decarboxylase